MKPPPNLVTGKSAGFGIAKCLNEQRAGAAPDEVSLPTGLPSGAVPEFKFDSKRRWRFDFAWPDKSGVGGVALEIEGGVWTKGRHTRGRGYVNDMEKYNAAALAGWTLIRVTPQQVDSGEAGLLVAKALVQRRDLPVAAKRQP